ncbi:MAG: mevalonate kinase [Chloroflexota bacterium]|nr:mevalonate kinase [Chloroflexota bacterium]
MMIGSRHSAPAKIILFGEHAVVYGQPAIAAPVSDLRASAIIEANPPNRSGLHIALPHIDFPVSIAAETLDNALALTLRLVLDALEADPPDVTLRIDSQIPIASGLGSGAAVSTALARALCAAVGQTLDADRLNALIFEVEKIHHGTPSGIDNTVIVHERPIYYVKDQPIESVSVGTPLHILIADTGIGASTRVAIAAVRTLWESEPARIQPILDDIGAIVRAARIAIEIGDSAALGDLMARNHAHLQTLTVSSPELDRLVDAAVSAGARGAKLSGGGRGGNLIALIDPDTESDVRAALLDAGAARIVTTVIR